MWRIAFPRRALVELISPCQGQFSVIKLCATLCASLPVPVTITSGVPEMDMRGRWRVYVSAGCAEQGGGVGVWVCWGVETYSNNLGREVALLRY